jgi:cyclopropane-fatty-acyl-phospholipid synthase
MNEDVRKPSIVPVDVGSRRASWLARLGRKLLLSQFEHLRDGELTLVEPDGRRHVFGRRTPRLDLAVRLEVLDAQLYADAAFGGTVGAGEAYIRGLWRCDDLTGIVRMFVANRDMMNAVDGRWTSATDLSCRPSII